MSIFKFGRKEARADQPLPAPVSDEQRSIGSPSLALLELFGVAPALSGAAVTPETAMRCAPVRAAVEAISEAVGGLPLHLYARGEGDARTRAQSHPVYALIHDQANDWTPASRFQEQLTRDALLWGNGFGFINRANGEPRELLRLDPSRITVEVDTITGEPRYRLSGNDGGRIINRRDMLHIQAPSLNGLTGASPVLECKEAIALAITLEAHAARLFGRGARPSGILKFPAKLGAEAATKIKASWQAAHGGSGSGGTAVLEEGGEFQPLTFNSVDSQFLEIWHFVVHEIARVYRVPPHMLFEMGRATWSNAGEMGATFLRFTLDRWLKAWTGEIRLKLLTEEERQTHYAEFLTDDLLRSDLAARAEAYNKLIAARVLNPNEVRAMENRAPYAGGEVFLNPNTTANANAGAANV